LFRGATGLRREIFWPDWRGPVPVLTRRWKTVSNQVLQRLLMIIRFIVPVLVSAICGELSIFPLALMADIGARWLSWKEPSLLVFA
jgi:hypothetical protein